MRVNAIMVTGNGVSACGKVHHIVVSSNRVVPPNKQEHMIIPFKFYKYIISTIQRILASKHHDPHNIIIDTRLKDDDILCNDLSSLGLSIAMGIEGCLNDTEKWEGILKTWCFTGEIDAASGEIVSIGSAKAKLEAASKTEGINNIMLPSGNRTETINWIKEHKCEYKETILNDIKISDSTERGFVLNKMWSLATRNILMWMVLVLWFLSISYVPVRCLLWDAIISWKTGIPQVSFSLPINSESVGRKLLNSGFSEGQVTGFTTSSLAGANLKQTVLVKNRDGVIEFEIVNPQDWTMILVYLCGVFILSFVIVIFRAAVVKKNCEHRDKTENINYDAALLSINKKEITIVFVDNIKQAERVIEYKSNMS
ncbi:MAG: hypothetical protein GY777_31945 [Candidatus Brocadiaceae bacterium]|nr:hypothetical protein [Candidatus Brocadiaceae bacterium]